MHTHQHPNTRFGESVQGALPFSPFAFLSHLTFLRFQVLVTGLIRVSSFFFSFVTYTKKLLAKGYSICPSLGCYRLWQAGPRTRYWAVAVNLSEKTCCSCSCGWLVDPDAALSAAIRCVWGCLDVWSGRWFVWVCLCEMRRIIILTCGMMCCSRLFTPEGRDPSVFDFPILSMP